MILIGLILHILVQVIGIYSKQLPDHSIDLNLVSNWNKTPFKLNVIESFCAENESLYIPLVTKLLGIQTFYDEEMEDYEVTLEEEHTISDKEFYEYALSLVGSDLQTAFIDINLSNKINSPRIESHYQHYTKSIAVQELCPDGSPAWIQQGDYTYCKTDDVFALKTVTKHIPKDDILLPFDRVIGNSDNIFTLYGNYESEEFQIFFVNLYQFALSGKLSFIWRYIPDPKAQGRDVLGGYGVDLTLKRTDYIVIDDRGFTEEQQAKMNFEEENDQPEVDNIPEADDYFTTYHKDIKGIKKEEISNLDMKLTRLIQTYSDNSTKQFEFLKTVVQDFPKFASQVAAHQFELDELEFKDLMEFTVKSYKTGISNGFYVNGVLVADKQLNVFEILKALKRELEFINSLEYVGVPKTIAKDTIYDFTSHIISATAELTNSMRRYDLSGHETAITFFNDLEVDHQYRSYRRAREIYAAPPAPGSIPAVSENIHDVVFAINLADPSQLYYTLTIINSVLSNRIPQRVGIVPIIQTDEDLVASEQFMYIAKKKGTNDALRYLFTLNDLLAEPTGNVDRLKQIEIPTDFDKKSLFKPIDAFKKAFAITYKPYAITNGVFIDLTKQWQHAMSGQTINDINYLYTEFKAGKIEKGVSFKDYLRKDAFKERVPFLIPETIEYMQDAYKPLPSKSTAESYYNLKEGIATFKNDCTNENCSSPKTITLIGSLGSKYFRDQVLKAIRFADKKTNESIKVKIVDYSGVEAVSQLDLFLQSDVKKAIDYLNEDIETFGGVPTLDLKSTFGVNHLDDSSMFLFLSGRFIDLSDEAVVNQNQFELLLNYENSLRLSYVESLISQNNLEFADGGNFADKFDWFEFIAWTVTNTFFFSGDDFVVASNLPRHDTSSLESTTRLTLNHSEQTLIDVSLIIDPMTEIAQKILAISSILDDMPFVSVNIYLRPLMEQEEIPIKRFYRGVYPTKVAFDNDGEFDDSELKAFFDNVPEKTLFTLDVDVPYSWIVNIKEASTDLDNVKLDITGSVEGSYELSNILVQGHARSLENLSIAPSGLAIELLDQNGNVYSDTNVMSNLGYLQLKSNPGIWKFGIKPDTKSSNIYSLVDVADKFSELTPYEDTSIFEYTLAVLDLTGLTIYPVVKKNSGKETQSLINNIDENAESSGFFGKVMGKFNKSKKSKQAEINIFTVASGHLYERFLGIMTASVMTHTKHTVKFWLIENYMSPKLKKHLPILAKEYGFEYDLITYKWPMWLREQREKQRTIWGYKILFLDVLFPQDLDKVIFVDSDQIVRTDMKELVDLDLEGAPYGYTPMGESRDEMQGFRFWKQGYWKKLLGDKFKYHISALYVIDLKKFRNMAAGDKLRQHYQSLSRDPGSLSNLDQDLPNNLQHSIKIHSLPQEWLWCETWCDDESLKTAKTIDLCNNPLTKEPKLDRARRQIPEWVGYDTKITQLLENAEQQDENDNTKHDEL